MTIIHDINIVNVYYLYTQIEHIAVKIHVKYQNIAHVIQQYAREITHEKLFMIWFIQFLIFFHISVLENKTHSK